MKIAIIGSGYVGLPLAIALSKKNKVVCFDKNVARVKELKKGFDINKQHKRVEILQNKITFTENEFYLKKIDSFIITVPTPINNKNIPNLKMLKEACSLVGKFLKKKNTVIFESTTYPGCTEEFCIPILEKKSNLKFNKDFDVAYSPERVNPGDRVNKLENITKVIGANDKKTLKKVKKIYQTVVKSIHLTKSIKIAESAKIIENVQRDINIALVNELSIIFNKLKIPTNEILKAASTKWNFHYYKPGLVGGHCISVDPYYLAFKSKEKKYFPKIILSGRKLNESMGKYVFTQTLELTKKINLKPSGLRIALLGFAFKDNIPDIRNTKIIQIVNQLKKNNIKFDIYDSVVNKSEVKNKYNLNIKNFNKMSKSNYDVIILAVSHNEFLRKIS